MIGIHAIYAIPFLVVGWIGLHLRKSVIGGAVALLIVWQGVLALAALIVFQRAKPEEGEILLWVFVFGSLLTLVSVLALGLRRYYADQDVNWDRNEEIRH